jgi:dephospho-CoA kinase
MRPDPTRVIGLTGGVASGKSTVARLLAEASKERWEPPGIEIVDADRIARAVTERPEVVDRIAEALGDEGVRATPPARGLDREVVARLVFADPEKRRALEAIVHPVVHSAIEERLVHARARGHSVVLDVPLLYESGWESHCDVVVHVDVPEEERERRAATRGWEPGERARREAAQTPVAEKRARAHHLIDNAGDPSATRAACHEILARIEGDTRGSGFR